MSYPRFPRSGRGGPRLGGPAATTVNMCGWVLLGSTGVAAGDVADSCSQATQSGFAHRLAVGRDFNAAAHEATTVPANPGCTLSVTNSASPLDRARIDV